MTGIIRLRTLWVICACWILISSCGYRFSGGGRFPDGIESVFVEIFENNTSETGIEQTFTNDLIYEITRNGNVRFAGKGSADGIISGVLVSSATETVSRSGVTAAAERRVSIRIDIKLTRPDGKVVWSAKGVTGNESYVVADDNQVTEENKLAAIEQISEEFAESVLNRLTSDF